MKYLQYPDAPSFGGIIAVLVIALLFVVIATSADSPVMTIIGTILAGIALFMAVGMTPKIIEYKEKKQTVATENLQKKYDIKDAQWKAEETTAEPETRDVGSNLVIETSEGKLYIFKYKVDGKSNEPTLSDMPIAGGTAEENITADSLLKTK